jgi:hypothetical protein
LFVRYVLDNVERRWFHSSEEVAAMARPERQRDVNQEIDEGIEAARHIIWRLIRLERPISILIGVIKRLTRRARKEL